MTGLKRNSFAISRTYTNKLFYSIIYVYCGWKDSKTKTRFIVWLLNTDLGEINSRPSLFLSVCEDCRIVDQLSPIEGTYAVGVISQWRWSEVMLVNARYKQILIKMNSRFLQNV